jgi:hypothetical protein
MKKKPGFTYYNYLDLKDEELKELTEGSINGKIQEIRSREYKLTKKQRIALCIHIHSNGKYDDYTYFHSDDWHQYNIPHRV